MVSYTFLDFLWLAVWKLFLPLGVLVLIVCNLPAIIGGIFGYVLGLLILPFQLLYFAVFDNPKKNRNNNSQSRTESEQKQYSHSDNPEEQNDSPSDLYGLLGVNATATKEEIRAAFKAKMMMNHPDKLATLDPELQKLATQRTVAIKDAYERLTAQVH